jgi:acetolactate synthase regulatory subunit
MVMMVMVMNRREQEIRVLNGIQTHGFSVESIKASDRTASGNGNN